MIVTEMDGDGRSARVRVAGRLDCDAARAMRPALEELTASPRHDVVLDLTEVTFLDGAGIGAVAFLFKRLAAHGHRLAVVGLSGQPRTFFEELGLGGFLGRDGIRPPRPAWRTASVGHHAA